MNVNSPAIAEADLRHATLAILVGGAGRRMGRPKAWLELDGRPILARLHQALNWAGPTLLVSVPDRPHPPACELFDREVVDPIEAGPLRGVLTALEHSTTPMTIVIPVDMPNLRTEHLRILVERIAKDAMLLGLMLRRSVDGEERVEPLPFACRSAAAVPIAAQLASGIRSLHSMTTRAGFAAQPAPTEWPMDVWRNLNRPEDL